MSNDRIPSKERRCDGKMKLKGKVERVKSRVLKLSAKHGHQLGLYDCPHCDGYHTTTNLTEISIYGTPLIYTTP